MNQNRHFEVELDENVELNYVEISLYTSANKHPLLVHLYISSTMVPFSSMRHVSPVVLGTLNI